MESRYRIIPYEIAFVFPFCSSTCNVERSPCERNKVKKVPTYIQRTKRVSNSLIHSHNHTLPRRAHGIIHYHFRYSAMEGPEGNVTKLNRSTLLLLILAVDPKLPLNGSRFNFEQAHVEDIKKTHLRDLLTDDKRCQSMFL